MTAYSVATGDTLAARLTMAGGDTLQVDGTFSVATNAQTVRFSTAPDGAEIHNDGLIENTASGGRAIRFETAVGSDLTALIDNEGRILAVDDAIQIQAGTVSAGTLTITNGVHGKIISAEGQALDLASASGEFLADIDNAGSLASRISDGVRIAGGTQLVNSGAIRGGAAAGYVQGADGVQIEDGAGGLVFNASGGVIVGDRHGINAGEDSSLGAINEAGGSIVGRNGSGIGSDGAGLVVNYGMITGFFADAAGSDVNGTTPDSGPDGVNDGDGDGIDIDGEATIQNYGLIRGLGAGGTGSDGLPNTAEGIAAGGGDITNFAGGKIYGAGLGILIDDSSQGDAPFETTIENAGTIQGGSSYAIKIVSNLDDVVINSGRIIGGGGNAILFGSGDNVLAIDAGSAIRGLSDGGAGDDALDYSLYGAGARVNLETGRAVGTGGVTAFETVVGSDFGDSITGDATANTLFGQNGNDRLFGGAGDDTIIGGDGADVLRGDGGADTFAFDVLPLVDEQDRVVDFTHGEDVVAFDSSVFTALSAGALTEDAFTLGSEATTLDQRIVYDARTGRLFYDADGSDEAQAAVLIATLTGKPTVDASDILVV
ncbi:Ca2+-binding RTX toxin-like protein [Methylopila capsulata]|uniref:Ca2+-binding RTX toxin-like protein n=1 Tax=Methylopila capsulata TaxID=61654 RepID=A0A9W6MRT4_9HYPH|nr:calcium-binding protein [Methylopila capsulata]MBM7850236.1 Ca2+-binding RTX toxin-like protein [Methylopila capsulata]GLK55529.1 hypothetical protein GCM10008170_15480 [Methylopila capsulata]